MGLGKTVELLACLLAHPFTPTHHVPAVKAEPGSNKVHLTTHPACTAAV